MPGEPHCQQRHRELQEESSAHSQCRNGDECHSAPFMALLDMWERESGGEGKADHEPWAVSPGQPQPRALMPGRKGQGSIRESDQSVQSLSQPSPSFHQTLGTWPGPCTDMGLSCKFSRWFLD